MPRASRRTARPSRPRPPSDVTRGDWIVVLVVLVAAALSYPAAGVAAEGSADTATIESPAGSSSVSLSEEADLHVEGRTGGLDVRVSGGSVRVFSARCPDKRCMRMGPATEPGDVIVCVPNGISVTIGGERADALDAVSR